MYLSCSTFRLVVRLSVYIVLASMVTVKANSQPIDNVFNVDKLKTAKSPAAQWNSRPAFTAFWNVPSYDCSNIFNLSLHLDKYGIKANKGENFTGDQIVIFYDDELGFYPYIDNKLKLNEWHNGGLPQLANLSMHLERAAEDVIAMIPDAHFQGIAILDWEAWRPQWEQNFDTRSIYRKQSIKLVRDRHPEWSNETIELVAIIEFEQAAKQFMDSTLRLAKELRPNGQWGFYHYPYCYNGGQPGRVCTSEAVTTNDNITWLFDSSTALYPSIYLPGAQSEKGDFVHGVISEAMRVRKQSRNPFVDVYPYTRYFYAHSELFYRKAELNVTILQAAQMGCSGVVFWGSKNDTHTFKSCQQLQNYVDLFLGPFVKIVTDAATACSMNICSANGRCVGDIIKCASSSTKLRESGQLEQILEKDGKWIRHSLIPCSCNCYKGWYGAMCSQQKMM